MSTLSVEDLNQEEAKLKEFLTSKYSELAGLFFLAEEVAFKSRLKYLYLNSAKQWVGYLIISWAASMLCMDYFWDLKRSVRLFNQAMLISGISIIFGGPDGPLSLSEPMLCGLTIFLLQLAGAMFGAFLSIPRRSPYQLRRSLIFSALADGIGMALFFVVVGFEIVTTMEIVTGVLAGAPVSVCIIWYMHKQYSKKLAHLRNSFSSDTQKEAIPA